MLILLNRVSKLNWLVLMVYSKDLVSGSLLL